MDTMTTREQISAIQTERDDARQDLRDTLADVNEKVGQAEGEMRPDHIIESHAVGASLIAGALGFLFGSIVNSRGAADRNRSIARRRDLETWLERRGVIL